MLELSFREKLHAWLDDAAGLPGRLITAAIVFLIVVSVIALPFELLPAFAEYHDSLFILEAVIVGIFTVEYFARIYAAPSRIQYLVSWQGIIDLASILPFYLGFIDTRIFRLLRLARLARVFKLARLHAAASHARELDLFADESIERVAQKHPVIFFLNLVPALIWLAVGIGIAALFPNSIGLQICAGFAFISLLLFIRAWLHYSHDVIYLTNYRVIITERVAFARHLHELYYNDIVDIRTFHPNLFAYLFGYGSIVIETSAGNRAFNIERVTEHEKISHHLDEKKRAKMAPPVSPEPVSELTN